ncbi:Protein CBG27421 [Caenorhabditis briggsae]|uniref:Protein CBG27421 n=1 Tax=Caenorhabditis briggsae TaxID=6238 RepID=B6IJZ8_CAEBR|nr:Protein CBG27421 [Caenorhabditis briggsae]CAS00228.1 Protein CBG27421 [Caenorhabditis briggsae]
MEYAHKNRAKKRQYAQRRYLPSIGFSLGRLHVLSIKLDGQLLMAFGLESSFNERLRVTNEELRRTDTLQVFQWSRSA